MACVRIQVSATGHYELSFVTTSEMTISSAVAAKSGPKRLEFMSARAATTDTDTESLSFAEFVILILRTRLPNTV
jgi:hypothetical protein